MNARGGYQNFQNDDLKITGTPCIVDKTVSHEGERNSWNDYEAGGNPEMIQRRRSDSAHVVMPGEKI